MVLNTNKKENIFGTVRTVEEDIIYKGLETKTAKVTVNNTDREIKVDVNVQNLLGFTPDTAYPGNQGLQDKELAYQALNDVKEETARAEEEERNLRAKLLDVNEKLDVTAKQLQLELTNEIDRATATEDNLKDQIDAVEQDIEHAVNDLITRSDNLYETKVVVTEKINQVESSLNTLNTDIVKTIEDLSDHVDTHDNLIFQSIESVKKDYAEKIYVYEKLVEFTKLSKQIVDNIDLVNNKIIINQESKDPVDGVLYLVKAVSSDIPDIYREYTTIDGILTLIGDTSISLNGYATEDWVKDQEYLPRTEAQNIYAPVTYVDEKSSALEEYVHETVDAIDLTPYAKKEELPTKLSQFENDSDYATRSDIPDVSSFIAEIPEEYVTDDELNAKGYLTRSDVDDILLKLEFIDGGTSASIWK